MALYSRSKLPPLKLTQHSARTTKIIHRGSTSATARTNAEQESCDQSVGEMLDVQLDLPSEFPADFVEPSHHELQSKASVKGWEQLRSRFLSAHTESSAMPCQQPCLLCPEAAEFRCQQCGPVCFYCKQCFILLHEKSNFFHTPEKWEVSHAVNVFYKVYHNSRMITT